MNSAKNPVNEARPLAALRNLVRAVVATVFEKDAQERIKRSESILRGAIDAINEAFVLFDPQDRLVFCNDKYRNLHAKSADLIVPGASFESIVRAEAQSGLYPEAVGRVDEWVAQRLAERAAGDAYGEQHLDSGQWLRTVERRMPDGHRVGFLVDITNMKNAAAAAEAANHLLSREQMRLQNILEGTNVGTWQWNVQTGKKYYNERWAGIVGYTLQELGDLDIKVWEKIVHPDDLRASNELLEMHFAGQTEFYVAENRMRHKDGHWVWVLDRGRLNTRTGDGKPLFMSGIKMDITERKLSEKALADTSAKLQNVLDSAEDVAIVATDLQGVFTVFNRGAERMLGYGTDEVLGQKSFQVLFESTLPTGDAASGPDLFQTVVSTCGESEWTWARKDGSTVLVALTISPMRDGAGHTVGYLGIAHDISRQKEYEASLQAAMRQAEQSSVAKSQFLANMSHEIRTPMNAILGMLQLLHNTQLTTQQSDYVDKTQGAARSLLGLLNDILDFSKVEAGKMQLDLEPFLLDELLGDLSVILSSNLGGKNVDLMFDIDPRIPGALVGDALRLKQVLINLGGNAIKFTAQGQVLLQWKLLEHSAQQVVVEVSVKDSGIGIAPENQIKIFEGFSQAEASTTRKFGGTGLGLAISRRLVKLMGSDLVLQSELGKGSTFSFRLALPTATMPLVLETSDPAVRPAHVLVVDDNPVALSGAVTMMQSLGWSVLQATSGEDAIALVRQQLEQGVAPLDAVFVDWQMPGMDGWQTLRGVRRLYGDGTVPAFVMLSGQGRDILSQRSEREQQLLTAFLVKPLTATVLRKTFEQVTGQLGGPAACGAPGAAPNGTVATDLQTLPLAGMRILVTEDNMINQQVARELLSSQGALITLADNGRIAVDTIANTSPAFDLVLMDLQMPVMDGLEAARAIRLGLGMKDLPVIAMTANAMASDREACLAAGMNDHVGKPFDLQNLVNIVLRHTGWIATTQAVATANAQLPRTHPTAEAALGFVESYPWPADMDVAGALARMAGNQTLLVSTIKAFLRDAETFPTRVGALLAGADAQAARREIHAFKGLCGTLGLSAAAPLAAKAEAATQQADWAQVVPTCLQQLEDALRQNVLAMQQALAQWGDADPASPQEDPVLAADQLAPILTVLEQLHDQLKADDMQAMETHAQLAPLLPPHMLQLLEPLDAAMAEMDFAKAQQASAQLLTQLA